MKRIWKVLTPGLCIAGIAGAAIGWPVYKNRVAAEKLVQAAQLARGGAEQGKPEAEVDLGSKYVHGEGVPQDYSEALRWFRKAADQGNASGQYHVGVMYYYGRAVPQNYGEAIRLFRMAADQNYPTAADQLGTMSRDGIGLPRDATQAYRWYRKAAERGYARGEEHLGTMYYYGRGVTQDLAQAALWYRKAADQGDPGAQYDLGAMYFAGHGVLRNLGESRAWLRKAAAQGDEQAVRAITVGLSAEENIGIAVRLAIVLAFALGFGSFNSLAARRTLTAATGGLILLSAAYDWYGYSHARILQPVFGVDALSAFHWLLDVAVVALLVYYLLYVVLGGKPDAQVERALHKPVSKVPSNSGANLGSGNESIDRAV
jgi:TPR repeat protein